jgi:predicted O-linked N-acetylglucosamine transferase (SPINDLY family)
MTLYKPANPSDSSSRARFARAEAFYRADRLDEADELCQALLSDHAEDGGALHLRGVIAYRRGQYDKATEWMMTAIDRDPQPAYYYSLGLTMSANGQAAAAAECFRLTIQMQPGHADAYHGLGNAQRALKQYGHAVQSLCKALELKPDNALGYDDLAGTLLALNELSAALEAWQLASSADPDYLAARSNRLSAMTCAANVTPQQYLDEALAFGAQASKNVMPFKSWLVGREPRTLRPLRVGIVLDDLRQRAAGYFLEGMLKHADQARIAFVAYVTRGGNSECAERIKPHFVEWKSIGGMRDLSFAQEIRRDRIDVLIDAAGHAPHNRLSLFAWKPAPIQVSWPNSVASTGVESITYLLGDAHVTPESEHAQCVEKAWRLPDSYLQFTPPNTAGEVSALPMLRAGHITYGYFDRIEKVTDEVVAAWASILAQTPCARLLMKSAHLETDDVRAATRERFAAHGIGENQVVLEGAAPSSEPFDAYSRVDIALSPFPHSSRTVAVEALWMGVPMLCMKGDRFAAHICESIVHAAGLGDTWVADDVSAYVRRAVEAAADVQTLSTLRADLRDRLRASPLCDAPRFAGNFTDALHAMWDEYTAQRLLAKSKD